MQVPMTNPGRMEVSTGLGRVELGREGQQGVCVGRRERIGQG